MPSTPSLSTRISSLAPSPTVALNAKAKELAAKGVPVINLTVGEPDFATPRVIVDKAIDSLNKGMTKYGAAGGGKVLREAIANKLSRENGLEYLPNEIVAGVGAKEILFHTCLAMLNEDDEVLIPAPYWVSYTAHCEAAGAKGVIIPMELDSSGNLKLTPEHFERYATAKTKAVILNSPNNPGGFMFSADDLKALGTYFATKNWWIISDEIYEYLAFDTAHVSMLKLCPELRDQFILVNGMSKGYAMTGWRVGYACGPRRLISLVENLQSQSSTSLPPFIEEAAATALNLGQSLLSKEIEMLKSRRDLVLRIAQDIPRIKWLHPAGAFYLFIDVRSYLEGTGKSSMDFSAFLLERGQVAMVPGEAFGVPGFIRMSYATSEANITKGLQRLRECLEQFS